MSDELLIPMTAILMPAVLVLSIMVVRFRQGRREAEHLERMKAMDLGYTPATPHGSRSLGVVAIGAGVPAMSVFMAWLTSVTTPPSIIPSDSSVPEMAWTSAAFISIFAM